MSKLPKPPMAEVPRQSSMLLLAPKFALAIGLIVTDLKAQGFDPLVFETLRNDDRQRYIYGFGRMYDDGRGVVTYSQEADDTWHGFGLAADLISAKDGWSNPAFFKALRDSANAHGCTSGADWNKNGSSADEKFQDWPHIQFGTLRRSPSPRAARLVNEVGLTGLWAEVGAAL